MTAPGKKGCHGDNSAPKPLSPCILQCRLLSGPDFLPEKAPGRHLEIEQWHPLRQQFPLPDFLDGPPLLRDGASIR